MTTIAIIDYEIGNILSILSAFKKVGAQPKLTRDRDEIMSADGVVLPGVGAYSHGMGKLKEHLLDEIIKDFAASGKPVLGVCLGMQLLLSSSNEFGFTEGLNLVPGLVTPLNMLDPMVQKLPHVSWNELEVPNDKSWHGTILDGINSGEDMYFVHSYMAIPDDINNILSLTTYSGSRFCSSVQNGNVYGCQYHPEKSAGKGLNIIANFVQFVR